MGLVNSVDEPGVGGPVSQKVQKVQRDPGQLKTGIGSWGQEGQPPGIRVPLIHIIVFLFDGVEKGL